MKKLREALPEIGMIDVEAIIISCLKEHLVKVNRLLEWVETEIKNDPFDGLMEVEETFRDMLATHGSEKREKWFKDKVDALNRKRASLESKKSKYNISDAMEIEHIIKSYRDSINSELSMIQYRGGSVGKHKKEYTKNTLKIMGVINGIKYERGN